MGAFLAELYAKGVPDARNPPEGRREGQFRSGWHRHLSGPAYSKRTLNHITWNNLGYRLSAHLRATDESRMDIALGAAVAEWWKSHPPGTPRSRSHTLKAVAQPLYA